MISTSTLDGLCRLLKKKKRLTFARRFDSSYRREIRGKSGKVINDCVSPAAKSGIEYNLRIKVEMISTD